MILPLKRASSRSSASTLPRPSARVAPAPARPWPSLLLVLPMVLLLGGCAGVPAGAAGGTSAPPTTPDQRAAERARVDAELATAQAEATAARTRAEGLQRELEQLRAAAPAATTTGRRP